MTAVLNRKKPKSILGFEPGRLRQNAIALPLAPLPPPCHHHCQYLKFLVSILITTATSLLTRNRFKSFEVCMGFCAAERPEVVTAVPGTELEPPPPPPPTHPGEISAKLDLRILVSKQEGPFYLGLSSEWQRAW